MWKTLLKMLIAAAIVFYVAVNEQYTWVTVGGLFTIAAGFIMLYKSQRWVVLLIGTLLVVLGQYMASMSHEVLKDNWLPLTVIDAVAALVLWVRAACKE